jgi:DNA sulfur modification protein DndC
VVGDHRSGTAKNDSEVRTDFARQILAELRNAYLSDTRPWIIGFSGGKDSTCLMQFVYYMLARLAPEERHKPVYVLASDTRVETPSISLRIRTELSLVGAAAERDNLPVSTQVVFPKLNDTFWVNLVGRGYPSPTSHFRWCTDRLKIYPVSNFIRNIVERTGTVVIVLGARKAESQTRAQAMAARRIEGQRFRPHTDLLRAWVYTPLEELSTNEVWTYLLQVPSPWAGDNRGLVALYKQASGGECPLVIDTSTPSCGHSRFGCWTCTVVDRDKSMEALVESGEARLEPLLRLRDYLKDVRNKPGARMDIRRNGLPAYNRQGEVMSGTGPFTFTTRHDLLRRVLEAQRDSGIALIEGDELAAIQEVWSEEDTEGKSSGMVKQIWDCVFKEVAMTQENSLGTAPEKDQAAIEDELLQRVCEQQNVPFEMMRKLRDAEERFRHLKRRHGLPEEMRDIVREAVKKR